MGEDGAPRILVVGSINTDLVMQVAVAPGRGETVTGKSFATFGGGKGANQAVAAARTGADVAMLGGLGDDAFGRQRLSDLQQESITTEFVAISSELPSGVAIILVEPDGDNRIAYVPGATWGVTAEMAVKAIESWKPSAILATLEHQQETLRAVWATASRRGIPVICNATPEPSAGRDLALAAQMLIVNEVESRELLGEASESDDWSTLAHQLRELGPKVVVITLGKQGALVSTDAGDTLLTVPPVEAIDTTGAGDAFCGGFAAEIGRGRSPEEAARVGVVAGSISVTRPGAQPSMPSRAEIDAVLESH